MTPLSAPAFCCQLLLMFVLADSKGWAQPLSPTAAPVDSLAVRFRPANPYRPTLRQLALPAALLGVAVLSTEGVDVLETDEAVQRAVQAHFPGFQTTLDDQLRHLPAVATLGLPGRRERGAQHG